MAGLLQTGFVPALSTSQRQPTPRVPLPSAGRLSVLAAQLAASPTSACNTRSVAGLHSTSDSRLVRTAAVAAPEKTESGTSQATEMASIGLCGLAVMGQNLALNIADKGFSISVYNRTYSKTEAAVTRAKKEKLDDKLHGYENFKDFVHSLAKPRRVIMLVQAGKPVDATIEGLLEFMEEGDIIIDGGNEWYENTERRQKYVGEKGVRYMAMGVSGGEEGARRGPSLMPGGTQEAYKYIEEIVKKVAAQVDDGPCVTYIGEGGAGNFVKMVHNGIEYGDMQLISEAYDVLKTVGGLTNPELEQAFNDWNKTELNSFLIEITALIFGKKDDQGGDDFLLDKVLDKTGMKGTGKWTVQQAAELSVAAPTIEAALDGRFLSGLKDERLQAAKFYQSKHGLKEPEPLKGVDKKKLVDMVRQALYAAKICSYSQGMNIIRAKSIEKGWNINMGSLARIWKGGCIIRAGFLDDIKQAYERNLDLHNLLVDPYFGEKVAERQEAWREVIKMAITAGVAVPGLSISLAYFDAYRRDRLPANLVQAQRDFFGSHTYERVDKPADQWFHTVWDENFGSADSITTSGYKN